ncbi:hypothetical protein [Sphingomonas sanxanigenens]|nr:hypothetical protein [Sphingomonas sanxanigenens]
MMFRAGQVNFSKGEIAPQLYGRFDVEAYAAALKRARNMIVMKYGGITKRPGTRLVAEVLDATRPVRLVPFQFSLTQTYALEFGHGYIRPCAAGGAVVAEELRLADVSNEPQARLTAYFHGYAEGDHVYLTGISGSIGERLNGRFWRVVEVVDADRFIIDADTSALDVFAGATGGIDRTAPPVPAPEAPTVPPPAPQPQPPRTGGGGGGFCVAADTMILMADGSERVALALNAGDRVMTRHEVAMEWGVYPVAAVEVVEAEVMAAAIAGRRLVATPGHRVWTPARGWHEMRTIGTPAGRALVVKIMVEHAHTYVSNGVLSHNIKIVREHEA